MKKTKEESLLSTKSKDDEVLELKIEIVETYCYGKTGRKGSKRKEILG